MMLFVVYIALLISLGLSLPDAFTDPASHKFIFLIGVLGIWRYSWGGLHFLRSILYRKFVFPRWRRLSSRADSGSKADQIYLLLTTFRIGTETTIEVYREAIREAIRCQKNVTLVVSIVEMADQKLIKSIFLALQPPSRVRLHFVRIPGTGKRDALAHGFRAIARMQPSENALVAVIDGDSILTRDSINLCADLFSTRPQLGALTTDEECEVHGDTFVDGLYRRWYSMRFAQRHILMSSMGLARRVLTLTGRMSMFRASIVIQPAFVQTVQDDYIDHWRLGRFRFLTGDDKSSWYHLLKNGWEMSYVPDVKIITVEEPPNANFFAGATALMVRWFGNMLRTNSRASKIPRSVVGSFTWWALRDQRLSMWTSLVGPTMVIQGVFMYGIDIFVVYVFWIGFTRLIQALMLLSARPSISASYPFFLYFNQVYGSLVKVYVLCHLSRQKWTRQKTVLKTGKSQFQARLNHAMSNLVLASYMLIFFVAVGWLTGLFRYQDVYQLLSRMV